MRRELFDGMISIDRETLMGIEPPETGFSGICREIALSDLIQLACLEGGTRMVEVSNLNGGTGRIYIENGEVVHAETSGNRGEEAFFEIMCWPSGTFSMESAAAPETSISASWNFLLIESLRRRDEASSGKGRQQGSPRVILVDDSNFFKNRLKKLLEKELDSQVAGDAANGQEALKILKEENPDLVLLDINMPVMSGDVALKHIMIRSPSAVALLSSFAPSDTPKLMEFFRLGAVDFINKPGIGEKEWELFTSRLKALVNRAREFDLRGIRRARLPKAQPVKIPPGMPADGLVVVIGGAGGLLELQKIVPSLGADGPMGSSLVIFQELCPSLVPHVADFFDRHSRCSVRQIKAGAPLLSNQVWFTSWCTCWELRADDAGAALTEAACSDPQEGLSSFLSLAAEVFKERLYVILLTGADLKLDAGLDSVMGYGGHLVVQKPDTAVYPAPLQRLVNKEMEEMALEPEAMADLINTGKGQPQSR